MTDKRQSDALHLADIADDGAWTFVIGVRKEIAAELRRQYAEIETLRTGYEAARLEVGSLQLQLTDQGRVLEKVMHELVQTHRSTNGEQTTTYAALPDEQVAFERHYRHLDLSRERDAWGNLRYTHDAVSLAWESWQVRASHGQAPAGAAPACWIPPEREGEYHSSLTITAYREPMAGWEPLYRAHTAQAAPAAVAGPIGYGPKVTVKRRCSDCKACNSESYAVQGDSGHYVYCEHPSLPERKYIGDTNWNTPHWCPVAAPTTQPAPQQEARPVTPYTCPKCHALWLHWPAEQSGFGMDTLNCRSTTHCDYCEKGGVEQLERLERVPAALKAPQQEAQEPVGYTHASWIAEAKRGGGGSFVGRKNAAFDVPIYTAPLPSPAAQGDVLSDDAVRVPLDSLHADAAYLIGRLREGSMPYARAIEIIRERIDAAKAAIRARAAHGDALDAARYRWLRAKADWDNEGGHSAWLLQISSNTAGMNPDDFDRDMDAALAAQREVKP